MPKASAVGGRGYTPNPHPFKPWDSNTICDRTGFRVKQSEVIREWEGWFMIRAAWAPRQPQDFPVTPVKQLVYRDARSEQVRVDDQAVPSFPII
jgi:hypothetical protein